MPRTALTLATALLGLLVAMPTSAQGAPPDGLLLGNPTTQHLDFRAGANLVSLHVYPEDRSLEALFGEHLDEVLIVKDAAGVTFAPGHGIEDLMLWPADQAVHVFARAPFALDIEGRDIQRPSMVPLGAGWSWVPVFADVPLAVETAFASLGDALSTVQDGDGRAFPAVSGQTPLDMVEPGRGYRLRLASASHLSYAVPEGAGTQQVPTVLDAIALQGLAVGDEVEIQGFRAPGDGGAGLLRVTDSGCAPDGGTCFVPTEHTEAGEPYTSQWSFTLFGEDLQWESFRLCHSTSSEPADPAAISGDGCYGALQLHGHGGQNDGYRLFDPATGRVAISSPMRNYAKLYDGDGDGAHTSLHRYATSEVRLERVVDEPLVLEGTTTVAYVRPEWWGGRPDVDDATDAVAWALESAEARAAATGTEHYVVLNGMYTYSTILETQQGTVLKGSSDGLRSGQGLRVRDGAAWHYFAVKSIVTDPNFREPLTERDALLKNGDPKVHVRHGRQADLARAVDIEIDGNLAGNDHIFSMEYQLASGLSSHPSWFSHVRELTRNTPHHNGFVAADVGDTRPNSNARLTNVTIHGFAGNGILSNDWTHLGGSRDLRIGDIINNHPMYGVPTGDGTIDGIEIFGFFWKAAISVYSGHYRNVSYLECERNPYGDPLESVFDIRNDNPDPSDFGQGGKHHFGEEILVEGFEVAFTDECFPKPGFGVIQYTRGPSTFRDVSAAGETEAFKLVGTRWAPDDGSQFVLEDVVIDGPVSGLSGTGASRQVIHGVTSASNDGGGGEMFVFRPQADAAQVVTVYDVHLEHRVPRLFKVWPSGGNTATTFDLYVRNSSFEAGHPVQLNNAPEDTHVYFRETTLSDWSDNLLSVGVEWFDNVAVLEHNGRVSDTSDEDVSYTASGGETWIDIDPGLFYAPTDPSYVEVWNVKVDDATVADLFTGAWTNAGETYNPMLRMELSRPLQAGQTVYFSWSASVRPIPDDVVFPTE